jgi:hypothetical protein
MPNLYPTPPLRVAGSELCPSDDPGKEKLISLDGIAVPTLGKFSSVLNALTEPPELKIFALALPFE